MRAEGGCPSSRKDEFTLTLSCSGQALNRLDDAPPPPLPSSLLRLQIQMLIFSRDILTNTPKSVSLASLSPVKLMHKIHHHIISTLKELTVPGKTRRKSHKSICSKDTCVQGAVGAQREPTPRCGDEEGFLGEVMPHAVLSMHENLPGGQGSDCRGKGEPRAARGMCLCR